MHNVLRVLRRDLKRLIVVPTAWVIIIGLTVLPAFYAWVNILGFWNPYGNTSGVQVSVANEDAGTDNAMMGTVNLGDQIVDSLKSNHDIGWTFTNAEDALDDVESGASYAAIVIPKNFSKKMGNMITDGGDDRPQLEYYVNEKSSPIAPKVTDTAANTVDTQVNETFVSTVSKTISQAINKAGDSVEASTDNAKTKADKALEEAQNTVATVRSHITGFINQDTSATLGKARESLATANHLGKDASSGLAGVSGLITTSRTGLSTLSSSSSTVLDNGNSLLSQASHQASGVIADLTGGVITANGRVDSTLNTLQDINDRNNALLKELNDLLTRMPGSQTALTTTIDQLTKANSNLGTVITTLNKLNTSVGNTADATGALANDLNTSTQSSLSTLSNARHDLTSGAFPQLDDGLDTIATTTGTLSGQIASQGGLVNQANLILDQLEQAIAQTKTALHNTDVALAQVETKLSTMRTDLSTLSASSTLRNLFGGNGELDTDKVADFMLSPTTLKRKNIYPVNSYGSGMAPLFTNLAMWAGAFMLVAMLRLETDDEGIEGLTVSQGYWGRWLLLAILAGIQGIIVTVGDLIIGVQSVNPFMFVFTGLIASLVYSSAAYMLATTFQHVGKALIMVLIIVQIPGAGGMYPIEMMPSFFRNLHPYFPFTYAINALRETIGGFYGNTWLRNIAHLMGFAALSFAVGLLVRPLMANVNRLFAKEISQTDLLNGEQMTIKAHDYRVAQALRALSDREEYREVIGERAAWFTAMYPKLKRGGLIAGILVPIVLSVVFSLTTNTKLIMLGTWTVWVLLIIAFLMTIELIRDSLERQVALGELDDETIRAQLALRQLDKRMAQRHRRLARARKHQAHHQTQA